MKKPKYSTLPNEIIDFLQQHAVLSVAYHPDLDSWEESFGSADAGWMYYAAKRILFNKKLGVSIDSTWYAGGYQPINDENAKAWHDDLLKRIEEFEPEN